MNQSAAFGFQTGQEGPKIASTSIS